MRTAVRTILITALAAGLIALFLRNADLAEVWTAMRTARFDLLALAVLVTAVSFVVRTERWQYLLAPLGPTRFGVALKTTVIGFAVSAVLPARAGEVLRPYLLARREGLRATAVFATIIVERVLDLAAILLLLAAYLLFFDPGVERAAPWLYRAIEMGAYVATPAVLGALAMMYGLAKHPERLHTWVLRIERVVPARLAQRIARLAQTFAEGLAIVRRPRRLLASLALSIVLWLLIASCTWVVALALDIDLPFTGTFLLTAMLVVGISVPTPGGVGGFHEAFRLGATAFFGAPNDAAVGAAILLHAVTLMPVVVAGFAFAAQEGLSVGGLRQLAVTAKAEGETA